MIARMSSESPSYASRHARCCVTAAIVLVLAISPGQAAQVYKWIDENGKVHFSDRPPDDAATSAESVEIKVESGAGSSAASEVERRQLQKRLLEVFERERKEKKEAKAKEREEKQALAKRCNEARDQLRQLQDASFLYDVDDDGERIVYTDKQRESATSEFEKQIEKHCG